MNDNSLAEIGQPERFTIKRKDEPWWLNRVNLLLVALFLSLLATLLWPKAEVAQPSTFVVHQGDSLIKKYGFDDGINVAERLRIPLRMRELGSDTLIPISYAQARALKSTTDRNLVTAQLYPGDRILTMRFPDGHVDLDNFMFFAPAPLKPQPSER